MANREELRRLNQLQNQSSLPNDQITRGTTKGRDRQTGKVEIELYNGGSFFGDKLFDASVPSNTPVQVNLNTKTADYRKVGEEFGGDDLFREEDDQPRPRSGNPEQIPEPEEENETFGNCLACGGGVQRTANCSSGFAQILFSDNTTKIIKTPFEIDYGVRASYTTTGGESGTIDKFSCAIAASTLNEDGTVNLTVGDTTIANVEPESISYDCLIKGFQVCVPYAVTWENKVGEPQRYTRCEQIGYKTKSQQESSYSVGNQLQGIAARLKYDSGIPRSFTVNNQFNSGNYGYFQIYQDFSNTCTYYIVGWKVEGARDDFSGAVSSLEQQIIYTGGCGFTIALGAYLVDETLEIYNSQGQLIFWTDDYKPGSAAGCQYLGGVDAGTQFSGNCLAETPERVPNFEKTIDASNENGLSIVSIECI